MRATILKTVFLISCFFFFSGTVYAGVFLDDLGRKVEITPSPKRIVSLAPGITEVLYGLGLDGEIAGVTIYCNYPEAALLKPKIGGFTNISVEKILSLNPDLIIGTADGNRKETVMRLESLGMPVYVTNPKTLDEILEMVLAIGRITGKEREAKKLTLDLKNRVKNLSSLVNGRRKKSVFFQVGGEPIITVGRDTVHNQLITLAGGVNIAGGEKTLYPRYSVEEVVARQPEVIILTSMKYEADVSNILNKWKKWPHIPAVKDNRLHIIDTDLIDRSSPRIVDALEEMVKIIHPEVVKK